MGVQARGPTTSKKPFGEGRAGGTLPFIDGLLALMPDAHFGWGSTVGSVIPTRGAIIPAAIGVDIGCGCMAVETDIFGKGLPDNLNKMLSWIETVVPAGMGKGHADGRSHSL